MAKCLKKIASNKISEHQLMAGNVKASWRNQRDRKCEEEANRK